MNAVTETVEQEIERKELNAPRVTMDHILAAIESESFHRLDGTNTTICLLTLKSGYTVTGQSACVSSENFDQELGNRIARDNAIKECWPLFGFHLSCVLSGFTLDS